MNVQVNGNSKFTQYGHKSTTNIISKGKYGFEQSKWMQGGHLRSDQKMDGTR
jgi:hypothetical protein